MQNKQQTEWKIIKFITIFIFSGQNGETSSKTSRGFTEKIINLLPISKNWNENKKQEIIEKSQTIIRKLAHFTIYTIAGIWMMAFANTYDNITLKQKILIVITIGMLYAISDEFHQMFSDGRTPSIRDVGIDTLGVTFGSIITTLIAKIAKITKKKLKYTNSRIRFKKY